MLVLLVLVARPSGPAGGAAPALLVAIGDVTATTAVVWARLGVEGEVAVALRPAADDGAEGVLRVTRRGDFTAKRVLSGLKPATRYAWEARAAGETAQGEVVTAPAHDQRSPLRFLWSGDLGGGAFCRRGGGGDRLLRTLPRVAPDHF